MSCPPEIERPVRHRKFVKPSSLVIRSLFGTPDSRRTKQMLEDLVHAEAKKCAVNWNFDLQRLHSAENLSDRVSQNNTNSPTSNSSRFEWKKEDVRNVADFYTRPVHSHYLEKKYLKYNVAETQENRHKEAHVDSKKRSTLPLSPRNANCLTTRDVSTSKYSLSQTFISSPKLLTKRPNQTSLFVVEGVTLQHPFRLPKNTPSTSLSLNDDRLLLNQCAKHSANTTKQETTKIKLKEDTTSNNETLSSKAPASRQLFAQKRKSIASKVKEKQPKITGEAFNFLCTK